MLLLKCALNTEQSITVLAESEKYLTQELPTAKRLTFDRTQFIIYQLVELDLYVNYFASSDILGIPGLSVCTLLTAKMPHMFMLFLGCDPSHVFTHITTVYTLTQPDTSAPVFTFISKTDLRLSLRVFVNVNIYNLTIPISI